MTPKRWQRVDELFHAALDRELEERAGFLASRCADDSTVQAEVERLLDQHASSGNFIEPPTVLPGPTIDQPHIALGRRIGAYRLVRVIASGGMGTVYEAVQDRPERTVALKLMKSGIASASALRRFEYESQVLGRLHHPGIAQIFEAGTHGEGPSAIPYFVMELIEGDVLTRYANEKKLGTRQRLELFVKICDAVHHGHLQGVIHRDLKPANILVSSTGQPKVIDFGVARATDVDTQRTTLQTDMGQLIGTLPYMSPEQLTGDPTVLDVRTDVYSLGVICYELVTGRLPYDVAHKSVPEAVLTIRDEEPPRAGTVNSMFRGDIDTILGKALEKEKDRRYASASDLAADVRRYFADEAISARPASTLYQLRKFSRRHRSLVAGVATAFVGLVAGTIFATWKAIEATNERNHALAAEIRAEEHATATRVEARKVERINQLLQDMLAAADPTQSRGRDVSVREILDRASQRIETELSGEPLVVASLRNTIGLTYHALGHYDKAEPHLRSAVETRREVLGEQAPETLRSMTSLATSWRSLGRLVEAEGLCRRTVELSRNALGEDDPTTLSALNLLALLFQDRGRSAEAEPLYRRILGAQQRVAGEEDSATLLAMNNLAWSFWSQGKLQEASDLFAQVLAMRRLESGDDHPETLRTMINLANALRELGALSEAEPLSTEAVESCRRVLGPRHAMTLFAADRHAWLLFALGELEQAERLARETLDLRKEVLGENHLHTLYSAYTLAVLLSERGETGEAAELHRFTLNQRRHRLGSTHADTLLSMSGLAVVLARRYKYEEAESLLRDALVIHRQVSGDEHPATLGVLYNLALVLESRGSRTHMTVPNAALVNALQLYRESLAACTRVWGAEHPETLESAHGLARVKMTLGDAREVERNLREILEIARRVLPEGHQMSLEIRRDLGRSLTALGQYEEAEAHLLEAYTAMSTSLGPEHSMTKGVAIRLTDLYDAWGKPAKAAEYGTMSSSPEGDPASP